MNLTRARSRPWLAPGSRPPAPPAALAGYARVRHEKNMNYPLISLFAGAGGLDLGLEFAGFTTYAANELLPHACETLRRNQSLGALRGKHLDAFIAEASEQCCFRNLDDTEKDIFFHRLKNDRFECLKQASIIEGDIREIDSSDFSAALPPSVPLFAIAGGPPCQPFSKAGKRKTLDCTKNGDLFFEFVRLVADLRPSWFIFENVKGIAFTKTDVLYLVCPSCGTKALPPFRVRQKWGDEQPTPPPCSHCNSKDAEWAVVNEAGGSLAIIKNEFEGLGYRCFSKALNAADYGAPQLRERLFIVGSRDGTEFLWPAPTHQRLPTEDAQRQPELFDTCALKPWKTMYEALWAEGHWRYGELDKNKAVLWVKNVVRPHDEPVTWILDRPSPTIGAHQGAKLALAPRGVPPEQLFRQQWHTLGRRQGDTPPVDVEHEYLSDEELLALQTFPRWWYLHGTRMQRAFQVGNAVPPCLAEAVGRAVIEAERRKR